MPLTPDTRNRYLLAMNELVGYLSINESKPLDEMAFCEKHQMKPSLFLALRDLDALECDFTKSAATSAWYKATAKLSHLTPEEVTSQMKASGRANREVDVEKPTIAQKKAAKLGGINWYKPSDAAVADFGESFEAAAIRQNVEPTPEVETLTADSIIGCPKQDADVARKHPSQLPDSEELRERIWDKIQSNVDAMPDDLGPKPLDAPYNIEIDSTWLQLKMTVHDTQDTDLIDAIFYKLNRVSAQPEP